MAGEELIRFNQKTLEWRLRIFKAVVYVAVTIAFGSFAFSIIDWQGFEWILIGATYAILAFFFVLQSRMIRKELQRRKDSAAE